MWRESKQGIKRLIHTNLIKSLGLNDSNGATNEGGYLL